MKKSLNQAKMSGARLSDEVRKMAGSNTFGGTIKLLSTFPSDEAELLS